MALFAGMLAFCGLMACDRPQSADGYQFERQDWSISRVDLTVIEHKTPAELRNAFDEANRRMPGRLQVDLDADEQMFAWALPSPSGKCEVHIMVPAIRYRPEEIGHEITHCLKGNFHGPH